MNDIKITSSIDFKTYFKTVLRLTFKPRLIVMLLIVIGAMTYSEFNSDEPFNWQSTLSYAIYLFGIYISILLLTLYIVCRMNMKKVAYLMETNYYLLNADKIEYKNESSNTTTNWKFVKKVIEQKECFLILLSSRSFHYLPKTGFASEDEVIRFKNLVKENDIKLS